MTKEEIEKIIRDNISHELSEEIDEVLENTDEYSLIDAFDYIHDSCDSSDYYERKIIINVRKIAILLGIYIPISDEELLNIISFPSGKNYDFKMDGIKYTFDKRMEEILNV